MPDAYLTQRRHQSLQPPTQPVSSVDMLHRLREVIRDVVTPSWIEAIPEDFGAASAGTPKAAEWRTLFRIHLPLALVSLLSDGASPQFTDVVDNTMELVLALIVSCRGTTSEDHATAYREHLRNYVGGMRILYPTLQCNSIHHLAFHIYDFLLLFGPVPSWWCFPYERLIGKLQRTNHNHVFGELEATIHRTFVYASSLLRWLSRPSCPDVLVACKRLYDKVYASKRDDIRIIADQEDAISTTISVPDVMANIMSGHSKLIVRNHLRCHRQVFSTRRVHHGNSLVAHIFQHQLRVGWIEYIYRDEGVWMYAIRHFRRSEPGPFAKWPALGALICSVAMEDELFPVGSKDVVHHVAMYPISNSSIAAICLPPSVRVVFPHSCLSFTFYGFSLCEHHLAPRADRRHHCDTSPFFDPPSPVAYAAAGVGRRGLTVGLQDPFMGY